MSSSNGPAGVGFIGLGMMGSLMSARLIEHVPPVYVFDIAQGAVDTAVAKGASACTSPGDVARQADTIVLMLPDSRVVEHVIHQEDGILAQCRAGTLIIDMTSGDAVVTRRLAEALARVDAQIIDAPVSGGVLRAVDGTLTIMVGGPEEIVARAHDLLSLMGTKIVHLGGLGSGHIVKALNNFLYATSLIASAEALIVAKKLGVDPKTAMEAFSSSSGGNWALQNYIKSHVVPRNFENAMSAPLMYKDLVHATNLGMAARVPMLVANLMREQFCEFVATNDPKTVDFAIVKQLEAVAKVEIN